MDYLRYLRSKALAAYRVDPLCRQSSWDDAGAMTLFMEMSATCIGRCSTITEASNHGQLADEDQGTFQGLNSDTVKAVGLVHMMISRRRILPMPGRRATLLGGH